MWASAKHSASTQTTSRQCVTLLKWAGVFRESPGSKHSPGLCVRSLPFCLSCCLLTPSFHYPSPLYQQFLPNASPFSPRCLMCVCRRHISFVALCEDVLCLPDREPKQILFSSISTFLSTLWFSGIPLVFIVAWIICRIYMEDMGWVCKCLNIVFTNCVKVSAKIKRYKLAGGTLCLSLISTTCMQLHWLKLISKIMHLWFHLTISRSGNITNLTDLFTHFQVLGDEQHPHTKQSDQLAHHGIYHCEFCPRITLYTSDREFFHELKKHFLNVFSASWTQFLLVLNSIKNWPE